MKKSKKQVSATSEMLLAASLCADIGKGLLLALIGSIMLGRIGSDAGGILTIVVAITVSIVLIGFSFYFTRLAAKSLIEKESK